MDTVRCLGERGGYGWGENNSMEFTFYVITVIVLSEAWMETRAHTQTHKSEAVASLVQSRKQKAHR